MRQPSSATCLPVPASAPAWRQTAVPGMPGLPGFPHRFVTCRAAGEPLRQLSNACLWSRWVLT